ncbi:MAG: NAD(P)-binding domain-containing protein [Ferruginibacter sp.]|nr:NAD(P)-binding domain-containing protein [Cytophagales bacterium]
MKDSVLEVIVVGAGHAGLSASYYLKQLGLAHLVFDRGRIGETWRSQRWDSFRLNTSNRLNGLPGATHPVNEPDAFGSAAEFVASLEEYAGRFQLPVAQHAQVLSIQKPEEAPFFKVTVSQHNRINDYYCRQVIIASGALNESKVPAFASQLSPRVRRLHAGQYRNPAQLPAGAVLVVGSGQSGCQIAEDLLEGGRKVYVSTSLVARLPRRYRGKDIMDWLILTKFMDVRTDEVTDSSTLSMKVPQLSGTGEGGHTIGLQHLASKGATLVGKLENAKGETVFFQPNAPEHVKFADGFSKMVKEGIDAFIRQNQLPAPLPQTDEADLPDVNASCATSITTLNLEEHHVNSIIWTTGFSANLDYLKLPVLDRDGNPKHQNGMANVEGLYYLGLSWLRSRKSSLVYGIKDDAAFITQQVYRYSRSFPVFPGESGLEQRTPH